MKPKTPEQWMQDNYGNPDTGEFMPHDEFKVMADYAKHYADQFELTDEEIEKWVNYDKQKLIDYEVMTSNELLQRLLGRYDGANWYRNEQKRRRNECT